MFDNLVGVLIALAGWWTLMSPFGSKEPMWISIIAVFSGVVALLYGLVVTFNGF